jgi:Mycothiol maleylpyruvate isomerase N-terminal domain
VGRREELLRAEAEGWEELIAVLDAAAPDLVERPGLNAEGWAVRDVMWHLAFWCSDAARALGEMGHGSFAGDREPDGPAQVDVVNDREFERSRGMEPDQVRSELHRGRSAMLEQFGVLEVLTADADEWFEESGPLHYAEHLPELEVWIRAHPR